MQNIAELQSNAARAQRKVAEAMREGAIAFKEDVAKFNRDITVRQERLEEIGNLEIEEMDRHTDRMNELRSLREQALSDHDAALTGLTGHVLSIATQLSASENVTHLRQAGGGQ